MAMIWGGEVRSYHYVLLPFYLLVQRLVLIHRGELCRHIPAFFLAVQSILRKSTVRSKAGKRNHKYPVDPGELLYFLAATPSTQQINQRLT
jgi:hypothetical protein